MSQWLGSLQIHDFNQTANRLKEQQEQSTISSITAATESEPQQAGDKGPTTADSEQPVNLISDVSGQLTGKEIDQQAHLESESDASFPMTDP